MVRLYARRADRHGTPGVAARHGEVERGMLDKVRGRRRHRRRCRGKRNRRRHCQLLSTPSTTSHPCRRWTWCFGTVAGGVPEHPAEEYRVGAACCSTRCAAALALGCTMPFCCCVCTNQACAKSACRRLYILHPPTGGLHSAHQLPTHFGSAAPQAAAAAAVPAAPRRAVPPAAAGGVCCGAQVGAAAKRRA